MRMTQPVDWTGTKHEGYIVNAGFSPQNTAKISEFMEYLRGLYGDAINLQIENSLHITLFDWIAPLLDYGGQDKAKLYQRVKNQYDEQLTKILAEHSPISVHFDTVEVHPTTVIIKGHDDGSFQKIRDAFVASVDILPGTKMPPEIIHSSIGRFVKSIPRSRFCRLRDRTPKGRAVR